MAGGNRLLFEVFHDGITIVQLEFIENVVDVILHGRHFDVEAHRDLLITQPILYQADNFGLASSEAAIIIGTGLRSCLTRER